MPRPALSTNVIEAARKKLAALPPPTPAAHSVRQAVEILKAEITALREQGYTLTQVAEHLNNAGIPVPDSTLRNSPAALTPPRRKRGKNAPRPDVRKAPAPAQSKIASPPPATERPKTSSTKIGGSVSRSGRFTPDEDSTDL